MDQGSFSGSGLLRGRPHGGALLEPACGWHRVKCEARLLCVVFGEHAGRLQAEWHRDTCTPQQGWAVSAKDQHLIKENHFSPKMQSLMIVLHIVVNK